MPTERKRRLRPVRYQGQENIGETILQWEIPEFVKHHRTRAWYLVAGVIAGIFLIYALFTLNFLFAIIIMIGAVIVVVDDRRHPRLFDFRLTDRGAVIGPKFYPYKEMDRFWIIYEPPEVKNIYFSFKTIGRTNFTVPLADANPLEVRDLLLDFIPEDLDQETESPTDSLRRILRF